MEDELSKALSVVETCQVLGISRPTAMRWLRSGKLSATMVGGKWRIPRAEIQKRLTYRIVRDAPLPMSNGPLKESEVERITDMLAHALRQLGAPVRKDGLRKVVLGEVPVDAMLWRFIDLMLVSAAISQEAAQAQISEAWDQYLYHGGDHPWTGETATQLAEKLKSDQVGRVDKAAQESGNRTR